ncbi:MAG: carbon storage regulator [Alphaproteobacteria bacterium]|nr:carbon storage regulator [Alphaproteobacteria bacterium]
MLYLARKEGESVIINNTIELTVVEVRGRTVKLGFVFPPEASVMRKELYEKIKAQNIAASSSEMDESAFHDIQITVEEKSDGGG